VQTVENKTFGRDFDYSTLPVGLAVPVRGGYSLPYRSNRTCSNVERCCPSPSMRA